MADISKFMKEPTLAAVDKIVKQYFDQHKKCKIIDIDVSNFERQYLGASQIGDECWKKLWYSFRWCADNEFKIESIRKIQSGYFSEMIMADRLKLVPEIQLHTENEKGGQFSISDFEGHFSGHLDGAIKGLLQAPKTWHVWENKDSEKGVKEIRKLKQKFSEKEVLKNWNEIYYGQAQLYMGYTGMKRHYLTCTFGCGRDYESIRTDFDKKDFEALKNKTKTIIYNNEPENLFQCSTKKDYYKCKESWCQFSNICHSMNLPQVNCRTCCFSTPGKNRKWVCEKFNKSLCFQKQKDACNSHLYIPELLIKYGDPVETDDEGTWIKYLNENDEIFYNCCKNSMPKVENLEIVGIFDSITLFNLKENIFNKEMMQIVTKFDGKLEEEEAQRWRNLQEKV
jgi:hypothetical protein